MQSEGRQFQRGQVKASALVHCRGQFQTVKIVDYSAGGLRLEGTFGLIKHDPVQVELLSGIRIPGKVAWSLGAQSGVVFLTPLPEDDPALIELARRAARGLRQLASPIARSAMHAKDD